MKLSFGLVFLTIALSISSAATAQNDEVWSLQRCIKYAKVHNIQIEQQALQKRRARLDLHQSRLSQLPSVSGSANYGKNFGRSIDPTTNQFVGNQLASAGVDVNAGVTLFNFFQIRNTIAANQLAYSANDAILKKMINDISLNVANVYLQILLAKEQLKVSGKQIALTTNQLDNTIKQVKAGALPESNEADMEAQLAKDSASYISNKNNVRSSILQMKALLNLDFKTTFIPEKPDLDKISMLKLAALDPETIYERAIRNQPIVKADSLMVLSSKKQLAATRALLYPSLSFGARFGTNYSSSFRRPAGEKTIQLPPTPIGKVSVGGDDYMVNSLPTQQAIPQYEDPAIGRQFGDNLRESVALSLSIPLFNGWQNRARVHSAEIDVESQELTRENDLLTLKQDIYTAYSDAIAAKENYNAAQKTLTSTKKAFYYAQKRYEVGMINSLEYLTSQNDLFNAQTDLISKHYDYIFKMKVLEFYKNLRISL